jgi:4-diphosphocytidyl-2-C-methyl-D-erythritol kinase
MVERDYGLPGNWLEKAAKLGADVPACVASVACIGTGTGTDLATLETDLAGLWALLVNPRLPLATGPVFKAWDTIDLGPLPTGTARAIAQAGRNDLATPAQMLCPAIADVLAALGRTEPWLTRMSGSGATCFALYESEAEALAAQERIAGAHPGWWCATGALR